MAQFARYLLLGLVAVPLVGGCAVDTHRSGKLASAGVGLSKGFEAYYKTVSDAGTGFSMNNITSRGRILECDPRVYRTAASLERCRKDVERLIEKFYEEDETVRGLKTRIGVRIKFAGALVKAYTAFGELAQKQSSAEFETQLGALSDSVEALGKVVQPNAVIPKFAKNVVVKLGGAAINVWHAQMLRDANRALVQRVTFARALLSRDRPAIELGYELLMRSKYNAVRTLWLAGKLRMDKEVERVATGFPVVPAKGDRRLVYRPGDPVSTSFTILLRRDYHLKLKSFEAAHRQIDSGFAGLIKAHEEFSASKSLDLSDVTVAAAQLKALIETYDLK